MTLQTPTPPLHSLLHALDAMPLVAILRGLRPEQADAIGDALHASGWRVIEVPLNSPHPMHSIERLARRLGHLEGVCIGAGTVTTPVQVRELREAGGTLVISPHFDPEVVAEALALGLLPVPGVATPSEACAALRAGAGVLKLFPAEVIGTAGLKALRAVLPQGLPLIPVGGIDAGDVARWMAAGARGLGIGSALFTPGMDTGEVAARAQRLAAAARPAASAASP